MDILIWLILKDFWNNERIPGDWLRGIIFPIPKEGDLRVPGNHRGTTLVCGRKGVCQSDSSEGIRSLGR